MKIITYRGNNSRMPLVSNYVLQINNIISVIHLCTNPKLLWKFRIKDLYYLLPIHLYALLIVAYLIIPIFMPQGPYYCGKEKGKNVQDGCKVHLCNLYYAFHSRTSSIHFFIRLALSLRMLEK